MGGPDIRFATLRKKQGSPPIYCLWESDASPPIEKLTDLLEGVS